MLTGNIIVFFNYFTFHYWFTPDQTFQVKILDFGLSKFLSDLKTKWTIKEGENPRYSAPEYILNNIVSLKSDIWSAGLIMYELFTEKIAYLGNNFSFSVLINLLYWNFIVGISAINIVF